MTRLFGTDGIRGEAGRFPLDAATIRVIGKSLAIHLRETTGGPPVIVTGRDTRESGAWIEEALLIGATEAGAVCKSAGVITTPGVAFLARSLPADAGVVISASHNPFYDNGIKIFAPSGKKLDDETERSIEEDIRSSTIAGNVGGHISAAADQSIDFHERYLDYLSNVIGGNLSLRHLRVVLDCANGAASQLAPELFQRLGASVVPINEKPDGRNINHDCGSLHLDGLRNEVVTAKANLGIAFDGDADRALFVDENGDVVDGDATLWVLAQFLDQRDQLDHRLVVATVMSNIGLEIALRSRGLYLERTDVGDKYVLDRLLQTGATLGGEQSGHLIFPRLSLAGDGMITAICLTRAMAEEAKGLSQLIRGFERYPQVLMNVSVRDKPPFAELGSVQTLAREIETKLGDQGRLLLRYSGTEPLARVMIEGPNQNEIESFAKNLASEIKTVIGR